MCRVTVRPLVCGDSAASVIVLMAGVFDDAADDAAPRRAAAHALQLLFSAGRPGRLAGNRGYRRGAGKKARLLTRCGRKVRLPTRRVIGSRRFLPAGQVAWQEIAVADGAGQVARPQHTSALCRGCLRLDSGQSEGLRPWQAGVGRASVPSTRETAGSGGGKPLGALVYGRLARVRDPPDKHSCHTSLSTAPISRSRRWRLSRQRRYCSMSPRSP